MPALVCTWHTCARVRVSTNRFVVCLLQGETFPRNLQYSTYFSCIIIAIRSTRRSHKPRDNEIGSNFRLKKKKERMHGTGMKRGRETCHWSSVKKTKYPFVYTSILVFYIALLPNFSRTRSRIHSSGIYSYSFPDNGWGITVVHRDK